MTRSATCCCGDCALTIDGEPELNVVCNCSSCKRRTGSAFGWSVYFADMHITASRGNVHVYAKQGDNPFQRSFCANCGTTLFWKSENFMPEFTGVAGGCFAGTAIPEPTHSASDGNRCAWFSLPTGWSTSP